MVLCRIRTNTLTTISFLHHSIYNQLYQRDGVFVYLCLFYLFIYFLIIHCACCEIMSDSIPGFFSSLTRRIITLWITTGARKLLIIKIKMYTTVWVLTFFFFFWKISSLYITYKLLEGTKKVRSTIAKCGYKLYFVECFNTYLDRTIRLCWHCRSSVLMSSTKKATV